MAATIEAHRASAFRVTLSAVSSRVCDPHWQVLVVGVCACIHLYLYLYYLPFYSNAANQVHTVCAALFAWATACLILAHFRNDTTVRFHSRCDVCALPPLCVGCCSWSHRCSWSC